jgi:hypothetical protein
MGLLEPGFDPLRAAAVQGATRWVRQFDEADRRFRHADDAVAQFKIGGCAFQEIGGDREGLLP